MGKKNKPIFLATGASTQNEIDIAVQTILKTGNKKLILMQATTQYPSPIEDANLNVMRMFKKKFQLNVGYSDHTPGYTAILGSIALGSCVIEKHFTLDRSLSGPDHPHSLDPVEFKDMVEKIREMELALGHSKKQIEKSENKTKIIQRRGIWTTAPIKKGQKFTEYNIDVLRPCLGAPASHFSKFLYKKAKRNYKKFSILQKSDL